MTERIEILDGMLAKIASTMAGVRADQLDLPTPCPDFDVRVLLDHLVTWLRVFDGAINERVLDWDPNAGQTYDDWTERFTAAGESALGGLRAQGFDRPMTMTTDPMPGHVVLEMMLMEYVGHGWDLAVASNQLSPFSDDEVEVAMTSATGLIQSEHRGSQSYFDHIVEVSDAAGPTERFVAFLGRDPSWAKES